MINNYKDLTLKKFLELKNIDTEGREEIDIQVEVISILSDMDMDEVLSLPLPKYREMAAETAFLAQEPNPPQNPPKTIKLNGREYTVVKSVRDFTAGQYIDYQNYIADPERMDSNLPLIMSVFIIPKGKKYGDDIEQVLKDAGDIPIETVLCLARFFFRQSQTSIKNTLIYLDWKMKRMAKKEKNREIVEKMGQARRKIHSLLNLLNDGDGYDSLI